METRKRPGQTLIEVTIAALVAAITTTAVFSAVLSSTVSDVRADKRDAAAMALKRAQDTLKSYVSAVPGDSNYVPGSPAGHWAAEGGGAWALQAGSHDISSLLNCAGGYPVPALNPTCAACSWGSPVCGFRYVVTDNDCGYGTGANSCKSVVFNLFYAE
ncbi:MAG: hypothetical protein HY550_10750 [Elusimicrobia bacterium]|nr:hypothetical protein [Elusimicrobiota bacterium]